MTISMLRKNNAKTANNHHHPMTIFENGFILTTI